jgi:hypothetical protein
MSWPDTAPVGACWVPNRNPTTNVNWSTFDRPVDPLIVVLPLGCNPILLTTLFEIHVPEAPVSTRPINIVKFGGELPGAKGAEKVARCDCGKIAQLMRMPTLGS